MCQTPKFIHVKSPIQQNKGYVMMIPCNRPDCPECSNNNRAVFVARCKSESNEFKQGYFVTLNYSDNNLIYYKPYASRSTRYAALKKAQDFYAKDTPFAWSEFVVSKDHAKKFHETVQKELKKINVNMRCRFYLTAEYGTVYSRPHYHLLMWFPNGYDFNKDFVTSLLQKCWNYGFVDVGYITPADINYVAKHQIKDDIGSKIQQQFAPNFHLQSTYGGSIGRNLINSAEVVENYNNGSNYITTGGYKCTIPRFLKRKLHPDNFNDDELRQRCADSQANFAKSYVFETGTLLDFDPSSILDLSDIPYKLDGYINTIKKRQFNEKLKYRKQKFNKKWLDLHRNGFRSNYNSEYYRNIIN